MEHANEETGAPPSDQVVSETALTTMTPVSGNGTTDIASTKHLVAQVIADDGLDSDCDLTPLQNATHNPFADHLSKSAKPSPDQQPAKQDELIEQKSTEDVNSDKSLEVAATRDATKDEAQIQEEPKSGDRPDDLIELTSQKQKIDSNAGSQGNSEINDSSSSMPSTTQAIPDLLTQEEPVYGQSQTEADLKVDQTAEPEGGVDLDLKPPPEVDTMEKKEGEGPEAEPESVLKKDLETKPEVQVDSGSVQGQDQADAKPEAQVKAKPDDEVDDDPVKMSGVESNHELEAEAKIDLTQKPIPVAETESEPITDLETEQERETIHESEAKPEPEPPRRTRPSRTPRSRQRTDQEQIPTTSRPALRRSRKIPSPSPKPTNPSPPPVHVPENYEKSYTCAYCSYTTSRLNNLVSHLKYCQAKVAELRHKAELQLRQIQSPKSKRRR